MFIPRLWALFGGPFPKMTPHLQAGGEIATNFSKMGLLDDLKTKRDSADVLCMTSGWKTLPWMATMISGDMAMHIMFCFAYIVYPANTENQPMQPSLSSPQPFTSYSMSLQNLWNSFPGS